MNEKHKPDTHYIYGLIDPATNRLRYIGRTNNLGDRLSSHVSSPASPAMEGWVKSLKSIGQRPNMIIIQDCEGLDPKKVEASWIKVGTYLGADLVNGKGSIKGLPSIIRVRDGYNEILANYKKVLAENEALRVQVLRLSTGLDIDAPYQEPSDIGVSLGRAFWVENGSIPDANPA